MNSIDIANGIIFQKLHIRKDSFDDRLISQKKIYLLQSLGTNLGYSYNWYVKGPYSPALTSYIYDNIEVLLCEDFGKYKLNQSVEEHIERVNKLVDNVRQDFTQASWYELLASLLYIDQNRSSWNVDSTKESLFATLMKHKPQFNKNQCEIAYDTLRREGFTA